MSNRPINLPLLEALLKHGSVGGAARQLGISQSAASQGLARLRVLVADDLLVPIGGRMELTPRARALLEPVAAISDRLKALVSPDAFDPALSSRSFVIAATDYMTFLAARPMLDLQRTEAPDVRLTFIEIGADVTQRMAAREIDFILIPNYAVSQFTAAPLRYRTLHRDVPGVLMAADHPLAGNGTVSERDLVDCEHVTFNVEALERGWRSGRSLPPELSWRDKAARRVAARVNHATLVPQLLVGTRLVCLIAYGMANALSRLHPLVARKLSFGPASIDQGIAWSPVFDSDAAHSWFRSRLTMIIDHFPESHVVCMGTAASGD